MRTLSDHIVSGDQADRIDKLPKDRKDWLEIFGNQWGTRRFTAAETTLTPEERAGLNAALNPFSHAKAEKPNSFQSCRWCGKSYGAHLDSRPHGAPVPRVPCTLLKSGFLARQVATL